MAHHERLRAASQALDGELQGIVHAVKLGVRSIKDEAGSTEHATMRRALFVKRFACLQEAAEQQHGAVNRLQTLTLDSTPLQHSLAPLTSLHNSDAAHLQALQDYIAQFGSMPPPPPVPTASTAATPNLTGTDRWDFHPESQGFGGKQGGGGKPCATAAAARTPMWNQISDSGPATTGTVTGTAATGAPAAGGMLGGSTHCAFETPAQRLPQAPADRGFGWQRHQEPAMAPLSTLHQVRENAASRAGSASRHSAASSSHSAQRSHGVPSMVGYGSRVSSATAQPPAFDFAEIKARNDRLQALLAQVSGK